MRKAVDMDSNYLAEQIEDFIYEFDTYGYRDVGIDREEMVEAIKEHLKNPTTFQRIYEIWHNEDLSAEAKFEALGKEWEM
jgi:glycosyltransferase involved in cell wall biosynthesis